MGARKMVELEHEELKDRKVQVAEQLVPHYEKNGWKRAKTSGSKSSTTAAGKAEASDSK